MGTRLRFGVLLFSVILLLGGCFGGGDSDEEVQAAETATPVPTPTLPPPTPTPVPTPEATPTPTPEPELSWEDVVELLQPSVVMIRADFPETAVSYEGQGSGTGIVYSEHGYIVTNAHVVSGAAALTVSTPGSTRQRSARFIGVSPCDDLAVIKVDDLEGLQPATFGESSAERIGAEVAVLGYPLGEMLGLDLTVSRGVISKLNEAQWHFESLIQHDATLNPGNSGGPLVNKKGEVIGINTWQVNPEIAANIGFAISIDQAKPVIEQLQSGNNRHWLGMNLVPNFYEDYFGTDAGLVVAAVASGSSASNVGVRPAYLLTHLQGLSVDWEEDICKILRSHQYGDALKVEFVNITPTEIQFLEGEVVMGNPTGGIRLEIVHRESLFEEQPPAGADPNEQLTIGKWVGTAEVQLDYWWPCGADASWEHYFTEVIDTYATVVVEAPLEGETNPYYLEIWSDLQADEGGFVMYSSSLIEDASGSYWLERWSLDYDGVFVTGELVETNVPLETSDSIVWGLLPSVECSDADGYDLVSVPMNTGSYVVGYLGSSDGYLELQGMSYDWNLDFIIRLELVRVE
jgi:S1-C subfamily serine protease